MIWFVTSSIPSSFWRLSSSSFPYLLNADPYVLFGLALMHFLLKEVTHKESMVLSPSALVGP
jgi:uncharacterized membrane protein